MYDWLVHNQLSIHLGKTEAITFGTCKKLAHTDPLDISCYGNKFKIPKQVKYLGGYLDSYLNCDTMAWNAISKVNSGLKFIYRQRKYLNSKIIKILSTAILQPHMDYGIHIWYRSVKQTLRTRLQTAQNKMVRLVCGLDPRNTITNKDTSSLGWSQWGISLQIYGTLYDIQLFQFHSSNLSQPVHKGQLSS